MKSAAKLVYLYPNTKSIFVVYEWKNSFNVGVFYVMSCRSKFYQEWREYMSNTQESWVKKGWKIVKKKEAKLRNIYKSPWLPMCFIALITY